MWLSARVKLLAVVLPVFAVQLCFTATFSVMQDELPDHPGQCYYYSDNDSFHGDGAVWYPEDTCERHVCTAGPLPGKMTLLYFSCDVLDVAPPCEERPGNYSLRYPDCCNGVACPGDG